jgi:DNA-binding CsgD family transcriptional regulator
MNSGMGDRELLSAEAVRAFGLIAGGEPLPEECADSLAELAAWGFVKIDSGSGGRPVALNPEDIAERNLEALLSEAADRVAKMRSLRRMSEQLSAEYDRAQLRAGGSSEYIDDATVVNTRLDDLLNSARTEILAAQPGGPRTREQLERSAARDRAALDRGVTMLTLYRDSVRQSTAMTSHIAMMTGHGAHYRTLVAPYERAIVIDRRHAFVSDYAVAGSPPHAAWHVTDPAAIGFIVGAFMNAWQLAQPWKGEPRAGSDVQTAADGQDWCVDTVSGPTATVRTTPLERAILRDMVDGIQQRTTAARLGISPRTLTKHIEVLKGKFDAVSPAQLGCKFALSPDYRFDDSASADGRPPSEQPTTCQNCQDGCCRVALSG